MSTEEVLEQVPDKTEVSENVADEAGDEKPSFVTVELQNLIAQLLQREQNSEPGFPNGRPPKSPEDQMKFDKLKARKARKQIRLKEKNVVNSFLTNNEDYDVEKVLDFIGGESEAKKKTGGKK